jgi:hypothetical protein
LAMMNRGQGVLWSGFFWITDSASCQTEIFNMKIFL